MSQVPSSIQPDTQQSVIFEQILMQSNFQQLMQQQPRVQQPGMMQLGMQKPMMQQFIMQQQTQVEWPQASPEDLALFMLRKKLFRKANKAASRMGQPQKVNWKKLSKRANQKFKSQLPGTPQYKKRELRKFKREVKREIEAYQSDSSEHDNLEHHPVASLSGQDHLGDDMQVNGGVAQQSDQPVSAVNLAQQSINNQQTSEKCKICFENERDAAFIPCGHVIACIKCAGRCKQCPVCRIPYHDIMKLYGQ